MGKHGVVDPRLVTLPSPPVEVEEQSHHEELEQRIARLENMVHGQNANAVVPVEAPQQQQRMAAQRQDESWLRSFFD